MPGNSLLKIKKIGEHLTAPLKNHPTWSLLTLIFLLAVYALIIFGSYAVKNPAAVEINGQLEIKSELYQKVLPLLQERDTTIQQGIGQNYPDIFR